MPKHIQMGWETSSLRASMFAMPRLRPYPVDDLRLIRHAMQSSSTGGDRVGSQWTLPTSRMSNEFHIARQQQHHERSTLWNQRPSDKPSGFQHWSEVDCILSQDSIWSMCIRSGVRGRDSEAFVPTDRRPKVSGCGRRASRISLGPWEDVGVGHPSSGQVSWAQLGGEKCMRSASADPRDLSRQ